MKLTATQQTKILNLVLEAGQLAVKTRDEGNLDIQHKTDEAHSVFTIADQRASDHLVNGLKALFPQDTIISEEDKKHDPAGHYTSGWVIDPIDGSTRFSEGKPQFGVLLSYVENGEPVFGVIYYPDPKFSTIYYTDMAKNMSVRRSVKVDADDGHVSMGGAVPLQSSPCGPNAVPHVLQRHTNVQDFFPGPYRASDKLAELPSAIVGLLEGKCDVVAGPDTMADWDLAAPDAIARKAGAVYVGVEDHQPLVYGQSRSPDRAFLQQRYVAGNRKTLVDLGLLSPEHAKGAATHL